METRDVPNVLVVDDEEMVLELIQHQLSGLPYSIVRTSSASEAVKILNTMEIAVLLCDLRMPEMDGNAVLAEARIANPNIVSVLLTGITDLESTVKAINEGGIWKYVAKPWKRAELVDVVSEGVTRYRSLCRQNRLLRELARDITAEQERVESDMFEDDDVPRFLKPFRWGIQKKAKPRVGQKGYLGSRYKLGEVLGEGGTGTVYKADDLLLDMPVAIKVLGSRFTKDASAVSTLKEEARIAMQLSHRHIVRLHNLQKTGKNYFLVMEFVEGRTFRDVLKLYGKLPMDTVCQVVTVGSDALSYAHRHNVLHKDLKPANLMLSRDGVMKVIDFGVACLVHTQKKSEHVVGTPVYMSPEQICGETLDKRTDVYSLGVIVYQLLTGHTPFPEDTMDLDLLVKGVGPLRDLDDSIRAVVEKALARQRKDRWDSVESFAQAFSEVVPQKPC